MGNGVTMPVDDKGKRYSYSSKGSAAHARAMKRAGKPVKATTKKKKVGRGKKK